MKVVYLSEDHLITYQCVDGQFTKEGDCERHSEHVNIFSRRRGLNTEEQQSLLRLAAQKTCFASNEFTFTSHQGSVSIYFELFSVFDSNLSSIKNVHQRLTSSSVVGTSVMVSNPEMLRDHRKITLCSRTVTDLAFFM